MVKTCRMIAFLLMFCLAFPILVGAEADGVVFNVTYPTELPKVGEEFVVTINISNNPGFNAIQFELEYDSSVMECKDVALAEILEETLSVTNTKTKGSAIVAAASLDTLMINGPVAFFTFIATKDITELNFGLKDIVLADDNAKDIKFSVVGVKENVKEPDHSYNPTDTEKEPIDTDEKTGSDVIADDKKNDAGEAVAKPEGKDEETRPDNAETKVPSKHTFPDVAGHWAKSFVDAAVERGLFVGGADGNFHPDDNVTRAQFITVLWRMSGKEKVDIKVPFADIENEILEFKDAIAWGYAKGYINGVSDEAFEPLAPITREQGMKILHFYSGGKIGNEIQLYPIYDGNFKDSTQVSEWAKPSVYWAIYNKLISGISSDTLEPTGNATRAQLAKILINYLNIK